MVSARIEGNGAHQTKAHNENGLALTECCGITYHCRKLASHRLHTRKRSRKCSTWRGLKERISSLRLCSSPKQGGNTLLRKRAVARGPAHKLGHDLTSSLMSPGLSASALFAWMSSPEMPVQTWAPTRVFGGEWQQACRKHDTRHNYLLGNSDSFSYARELISNRSISIRGCLRLSGVRAKKAKTHQG